MPHKRRNSYISYLSRLLESPLHRPAELLKLDALPHDRTPGLVLLVERYLNLATLDLPPTHVRDVFVKLLPIQAQPPFQHAAVYALHALADHHRHPDPHQVLEPLHVGDQVGDQVVAVDAVPELGVLGVRERRVQSVEALYGFGQGAGGRRCGEDVWLEEGEAESEIRAGEYGEGFDEDVGDGFVLGEVRVELVSGTEGQSEGVSRGRMSPN